MSKTKVKMNSPVCLGVSILDISKPVMYQSFGIIILKPKYQIKANLCYMDTDSLIVNIKTGGVSKDIKNDVEKRFDTSNYEHERVLPIGKHRKVIGLMKDKLGEKIMAELVGLTPKMYSYLMDDGLGDKKAK